MSRFLADLVLLVHVAFIAFVVCGGLLVWRRPRVAWLHLPAAAWGAVVEFAGWVCPLTPLEQWLRWRAGGSPYDTDFIEYYLLPVLYPARLTHDVQLVLGGLVVLINLAIYGGLERRHLRRAMR